MNKRLYRIVFNDARGQLMVVAETATDDGKSPSTRHAGKRPAAPYRATLRALSFSLFVALGLVFSAADAQIVAYKAAPGNQRSTVLNAGNGVPLVNIQTPSAAGVSRNSYSQFDVQPAGAILNNARTSAQTQLGGWVQGNPWLATGSARVIVNEVVSANPSLLHGYVEVAGSRAQVVVANPAGVTCDGCGFINANRATLTTGALVANGGNLDGYRVTGGTIRIEGAGLDASRVDYTDLIARAVEVNAGVWAKDLKVTAGANQVDAANVQAMPIAGSGAAPAFAIDVARLGGMYANKIVLVGTEAGVGVRNAGTIGAAAGEVVVTADGKLVNSGTLISGDQPLAVSARGVDNAGAISSAGNLALASAGEIVNSGLMHAGLELNLDTSGQLANRQGTLEGQRLVINAERLANDGGTLRQNGTQALAVSASQVGNAAGALIGNVLPSGGDTGGNVNTSAVSTSVASAPTVPTTLIDGAVAAVPAAPARLADGLIKARGAIDNSGTITASGAVSLTAGAGLANAGTLTLNRLDVSGESVQSISNSGAIAATSARLAAPIFDNRGGTLAVAGQFEISAHDIVNAQGRIRHFGTDALSVALAGNLDNRGGQIASNGIDLKLSAAAVDNAGGRIEHAGDGTLSLATNRLDGNGGRIESHGALVVAAADAVLDGAKTLGGSVAIAAGTLSNRSGSITQTGAGSGSVAVAGRFDNRAGSVTSAGSASIAAGEIDNRSSGKIAANGDLALTTTTGALANGGGTVNSLKRIDARIAGELANASGQFVAGTGLALSTGGRVDNGGGTLGAVAGSLDATLGGAFDNRGGRVEAATSLTLASNALTNVGGTLLGQSVAVDTRQQSFDNSSGTVSAGGALAISSGQLTNAAGRLQSTGALTVDSHGQAITNTGGGAIVGQASVALTAGTIDNSSGVIGAGEALTLNAATLTNRAGRITQNGAVSGPITVAGRLDNIGGLLASATALALNAGEIDNRGGGKIAANGNLTLTTTTGALTNDGGTVNSLGSIDAHIAGELTNAAGQLVAGTDLALSTGGRVDNGGGTLGAVAGSLAATIGGAIDNSGGRVEAATSLTLASNGLTNVGGTLLGQSVAVDTRQQAFDNTRGTVSASGALSVASGTLTNAAGRLQAAGVLTVDSHGQAITNTGGGNILGQSNVALTAGALDNASGLIASADVLGLSAGRFANSGGRLSAQNGMTLTSSALLDNRGGDIQSGGDLSASASTIDNGSGLMRAGNTLTGNANRLVNASTNVADKGLEGRSLVIAANAIDNRSGALRASDALTIDSAGTLDNSNGLISSTRTLAVRDVSPARTLSIINSGGTMIAGTDLTLRANRLSGDGRILSHGDLSIDLAADFVNTSEVTADRNASFVTAGGLSNYGTLQAGGTLAVQAAAVDNTAAGKIAGGALRIWAPGTLTNRGLIDGGDAFIDVVTVDNLGSGRIYGNHLAIAAAAVNNHPEGGAAPVIAARERLDLGAWAIDNRDGALIFSAGDLAIGGALDGSHRAAGQAGSVTNSSATIEALGNLAINAASVVNQKTTFATARVASGTPEGGIALLDYTPELQFHWWPEKAGPGVWRDYIRDRYLDAISKLLGGGPDAALVAAFNPPPPPPPFDPGKPIGPDNLPPYDPDQPIGPYNQPPPPPPPPYEGNMYGTIWGDLTGYTGPVGGGLDAAYRNRLAAVVNAPVPWVFDDSHKIWQLLIETIAAEHPEYIDRMAKNLAARGPLQYAYRQICVDIEDCDYVSDVVSTSVSQRDVVAADSPAAVIRAGGNATINAGALENRYSVIQSGGEMVLTGATLTNVGAEFYLLTDTTSTSRLWHWGDRDQGSTTSASSTQTLIGSAPAIISAGGALTGSFSNRIDNIAIRQNAARVVGQTGSTPGISGPAGVGTTASGAGAAQTAPSAGLSVSSTAGTSSANTASSFGTAPARVTRVAAAGAASGPIGVVATAALALTLPASRLMHANPDPAGRYLVETDPAFASYRTWLSSDYLLGALALDPATTQKRLGDGFYEQRLITEQVAQLTGRRFLAGYASDEAQYRALMTAGATVAREWGLVPGVSLSEAQMARLTTDIVWLVEREVTQADSSTAKVLVPQVYARVRDGDLDASGALIAGNGVQLATAGDLTTSGTIAGRQVVALTAENIADLRGRIAGGDVAVQAANDLTVLGGSIEAERTLLASAGKNLTVASTSVDRDYQNDSTGTANSVKQTTIDRVAGLYVTGPGGTLVASAGNDLTLLAAVVGNAAAAGSNSGAGQTLLAAGNNLTLGTVTERSQAKTVSEDVRWSSTTRNEFGTAIQTTGDLTLAAGQDLTARAASVNSSAGALTARAGRDLTIEAGESAYETTYDSETSRGGFFSSRSSSQHDKVSTTTALSSTFSGDTVVLRAGQDIAIKGSNVSATGDLSLAATRDIRVETAQNTVDESHYRSETQSGFSASFSGGISYGKSSLEQSASGQRVTQVASTLAGGDVALASGRDTAISASNVLADRDLTILAGRNVDILAAANSEAAQNHSESESTSIGLLPSPSGRFTAYGKTSASEDGTGNSTTQSTSLLSANSGDLTVRAGLDEAIRGTGTGNIVTQGADLLAGGTMTLSGRAIDLQAVRNETSSHSVAESSSLTIGAALAGPLGSKITAIGDAIDQSQHTDNSRLQGALALKAGYDAYKLTQGKDVTSVNATGTTEATTQAAEVAKAAKIAQAQEMAGSVGAASASSGIGVSVGFGSSKSSSESSTHETQVIGTNLQARHIEISASETDLHMAAAKLQAETIALSAKRDVILEAAANTSELSSSNSGSSFGVGVTLAFGAQQNGLSFQLSASRSQGKANGSETTWDNTQITASDKLSVTSGRDTTLKGAQVAGRSVVFDVGGNLLIETLQDSSRYESAQSSSGFNVSVCWFLCAGVPVTGSVGASEQSIKHSYLSAVGQSGIAAGDGGFDIKVKGATELVGAAITSSAAASGNRLTTASLSSRDLENAQRTQSNGSSLSIGYGGGSMLTTLAGNAAQNVMGNLQSNAALPQNGSKSGTTQSVISPASITITGSGDAAKDAQSRQTAEQLTARDAATANGSLTNTLTLQQAQALQAEVARQQENMEAAKLVGAVLSNVVGDLAKDKWADGSPQKLALHGMVGLIEAQIGGGNAAAGVLGAMSQEVMAPILAEYLRQNGIAVGSDDYKSLMQLGATLVGTAVGTLATGDVKGASTGANAAFVGVTNNYLNHYPTRMLGLSEKEQYEQAVSECNGGAGKASACATQRELAEKSTQRDRNLAVACNGETRALCDSLAKEARAMGNIVQGSNGGYVYANSPESGTIRFLNTATIGATNPPAGLDTQLAPTMGAGSVIAVAIVLGPEVLVSKSVAGAVINSGFDAFGQLTDPGNGAYRPWQSIVAAGTGAIATPLLGRNILINGFVGGLSSGAGTALTNTIYGKDVNDGVWKSALVGGGLTFVGSGIGILTTSGLSKMLPSPWPGYIGGAVDNLVSGAPGYMPWFFNSSSGDAKK